MSNNIKTPRIAFIGGGNMAQALGLGLIGSQLSAQDVLVIDPDEQARARWQAAGVHAQAAIDEQLENFDRWVLAVKPQLLSSVVRDCACYRQQNTLVLSIAAGIRATDIAQ